jgi:hypothetical protein
MRLRAISLFLVALGGAIQIPMLGQGQTASTPPPGFVDGSKTPDLIPDRAAVRLILLDLMIRDSSDQRALTRQAAILKKIALSDSDTTIMRGIISQFGLAYESWKQSTSAITLPSPDESQAWDIVQAAQNNVTTLLTHDGSVKFRQYVSKEKSRMLVRP